MQRALIVFMSILLVGCATGNKYNYQAELASLPLRTQIEKTLVLNLQDQRPYVLSGEKAPDFVAPAYLKGAFTSVKLSVYLGKWVLLCFYPGDFTFV